MGQVTTETRGQGLQREVSSACLGLHNHPFVPEEEAKQKRTEPTPQNRQLAPLVIALVLVAGLAFVGYQIYVSVAKIRSSTEQRLARHNMVFTKDGMRVGVKHREQESYVDSTQGWVVKAWRMAGGGASAGDATTPTPTTATNTTTTTGAGQQRKKTKKRQQ